MPVLSADRVLTGVQVAAPDHLASFGPAPAVFADGRWLTYAELAERVAAAIEALGVRRRLVAVPGRRRLDDLVWMLAALGGGHVLLPHDGTRNAQTLSTYLPDGRGLPGAGDILCMDEIDLHPDLALLLSTSGTTDSPKLVRLGAEGVDANARAIAAFLGLRADDRTITTLPLTYCYGLSVITSHLAVGAGLVLSEMSVVDPCFWDVARRTGVTTIAGVPHTFDLLESIRFAGRETLPTVRRLTQAGGRMAPERVQRFAAMGGDQGWDLHVMYGQTEATARIAHLPPGLAREHSDCVGMAIPGGTLRIDDGELVYSGPNVMLGYATSADDLALGRTVSELRTGDRAELTDAGLVRILGRKRHEAKLFGLRIDLDHVERQIPGVALTVVGDHLGVVTECERDVLTEICDLTGLPAWAVRVVQVPRIPRLESGKVDAGALRELTTPDAEDGDPDDDPRSAVQRALRSTLGVTRVGDDDSFVSLGGDSLAYVSAMVRLERILGPLPVGWHTLTVAELVHLAEPTPTRRRWSLVDTATVLRAVAIVLIVASHTTLIDVRGGAHLLIGLAGYNFARFVLPSPTGTRIRNTTRTIAWFAAPAAVWLGLVAALTDEYGTSLFGVTFRNPGENDPAWRYWFVEVMFILLVLAALLTAPRFLAALERRAPIVFAGGLLTVAVLARELLVDMGDPRPLFTLAAGAWVFFLGWLVAVLVDRRSPWPASLLVLVLVLPFFASTIRDIVIAGGLLLLIWLPRLRLPRLVVPVLTALAAASLTIYLVHWQVYPPFAQWPVASTAAALGLGIAVHLGLRRVGLLR